MMSKTATFLLLLLSHILGDIIFTSHRLAFLKRASEILSQIRGLVIHSGIHAFFAGLFLFFGGGLWLKAALLVFAIHFLIDLIRCRLEIRFSAFSAHARRIYSSSKMNLPR